MSRQSLLLCIRFAAVASSTRAYWGLQDIFAAMCSQAAWKLSRVAFQTHTPWLVIRNKSATTSPPCLCLQPLTCKLCCSLLCQGTVGQRAPVVVASPTQFPIAPSTSSDRYVWVHHSRFLLSPLQWRRSFISDSFWFAQVRRCRLVAGRTRSSSRLADFLPVQRGHKGGVALSGLRGQLSSACEASNIGKTSSAEWTGTRLDDRNVGVVYLRYQSREFASETIPAFWGPTPRQGLALRSGAARNHVLAPYCEQTLSGNQRCMEQIRHRERHDRPHSRETCLLVHRARTPCFSLTAGLLGPTLRRCPPDAAPAEESISARAGSGRPAGGRRARWPRWRRLVRKHLGCVRLTNRVGLTKK